MTWNAIWISVLFLWAGFPFQAGAVDSPGNPATKEAKSAAAARAAWTDGEVRKVDKAAGKVTIKHGPMPKFDMPAMTMVYLAKDKRLLDGLKPGDKIKFDADSVGGTYTVLRLEKAK